MENYWVALSTTKLNLAKLDEIPDEYLHYLPSLQFIICQLENLVVPKTRRKYDLITMVLALKCQILSPACYNFLQAQECIILPHHTTLRRLYTSIGLEHEFISYLKVSTQKFNSLERNVILHMDEIHIKSDFSYTGGKIIGSSCTPNITPATTVLAFMVSSLCKKWSTIVHLLPCSKTSASELFPVTKQIISDIENCNLRVQVLCTDNYPLNVRLFKCFSPSGTLDPSVPHPFDPSRSLNLLFDFVHIIKTIRNNWLNQKNSNHSFIYPKFDDFSLTNVASFDNVRHLFKSEQHSVAKTAHRLTVKSCWPSSLERQNVGLALRVFNDSTVAALQLQASRENISSQTSEFIYLITSIWKIFNVDTPIKGSRLKDIYSMPLRNNDSRFTFLSRVVEWLDIWMIMPGKLGKLSSQTFTSFRHSCIALQNTVHILTGSCDFSYVLSSFLQNDPLEHHFGLYRMMSGAQYNITLSQILETERRIKLSDMLKLFSHTIPVNSPSTLKEFFESFSNSTHQEDAAVVELEPYSLILDADSSHSILTPAILQSLAFIAGYTVHSIYKSKVFRKVSKDSDSTIKSMCPNCLSLLSEDKWFEFEEPDSIYALIQLQDRGGLKWPSVPVLEAVCTLWKLYTQIEEDVNLFTQFIKGPSRRILMTITILKVESQEVEYWRNTCSLCDTVGWEYLKTIIRITTNCILSNKVKNLNSLKVTHQEDSRKLKKFKST